MRRLKGNLGGRDVAPLFRTPGSGAAQKKKKSTIKKKSCVLDALYGVLAACVGKWRWRRPRALGRKRACPK